MSGAIKTLIVDDEPVARQILREELTLLSAIDLVGEAQDGPQALRMVTELQPDLVFLDVQMPELDGFEVVRRLAVASQNARRLPVIVMVTAFQEHAIAAFEAGAVDYLLKPVRGERLQMAVERAQDLLGKPREIARALAKIASADGATPPGSRKMVGRIGRDYFLLDLDEVLAIQAEGELVWIVTAKRRFLALQTLRSAEMNLPAATFQRIHRNAIVNTDQVRRITTAASQRPPGQNRRWMLTLSNGQEFAVSKRQAHSIRRLLRQ